MDKTGMDKAELLRRDELTYATWLQVGSHVSLVVLAVTFAIYLSGAVPPAVPVADLPRYWGLSAAQYLAATGSPTGWRWLGLMGKSDDMNMIGVACIALVTPVCYLRILPEFVLRRDWPFAIIAAVEILILAVAASGLISG